MSLFGTKKQDHKDTKKKSQEAAPVSMKDLYGENGEVKATAAKLAAKKPGTAGRAWSVLLKPLVTEKAADQAPQNKYFFSVALKTNKIEIAKAVEEVYGIKPTAVNIINREGKTKRYGRSIGKRKDLKKAVVTLPEGKTINVYEGV